MLRGVWSGYLIGHFGIRGQCYEGMSEANRDEQLVTVFSAEFGGYPTAIGRRVSAQIDGVIHDCAPDASDEFVLGEGRALKVNAPDGSASLRKRVVFLNEGAVDAGRRGGRQGPSF